MLIYSQNDHSGIGNYNEPILTKAMPAPPLPIQTPATPNAHRCSDDYGKGLSLTQCYGAGAQFPTGSQPMPYEVNGKDSPYVIPFVGQQGLSLKSANTSKGFNGLNNLIGNCMITLEQAGPSPNPGPIMISPDDVRGMAGYVVQQCVADGGGVGGFVTASFENMIDYILNPDTDINGPYRKCTFTIPCYTESID